eukprot:5067690-Pleurochrysis_carterae.AAC.1
MFVVMPLSQVSSSLANVTAVPLGTSRRLAAPSWRPPSRMLLSCRAHLASTRGRRNGRIRPSTQAGAPQRRPWRALYPCPPHAAGPLDARLFCCTTTSMKAVSSRGSERFCASCPLWSARICPSRSICTSLVLTCARIRRRRQSHEKFYDGGGWHWVFCEG